MNSNYLKLSFSLLLVTFIITSIYIGVGYYIYSTLAKAEPGCASNCINNPSSFKDNDEISSFPYDDFAVSYWENKQYQGGDVGIQIDAWWIPISKEGPGEAPVIIVTHGLRISKFDPDMLIVAGMLNHAGFNVLLFDLRDHGKSTIEDGKVSLGTKEYRDVIASVDWLVKVQGFDYNRIGIYGDSMGAATAAIAFGLDKRIQALVLDNGYLDLNLIIQEELQREGFPSWLALASIWAADLFGGEKILEFSPKLAFINHANRPIFAMHGTADTRVLPHHTEDMKLLGDLNGANLITWFVENVGHSDIKYMNSQEFSDRIVKFFSNSLEGELKP